MPDRTRPSQPPPHPPAGPVPAQGEPHPAAPDGTHHGPHPPPAPEAHAHDHGGPHHGPHPPPRRAALTAGDALYLSAMLLSTLWAAVLLFVVYPQSPVDAGYAADDVPVMSVQGNVVTVKRAALEEALASGRYLAPSREQVEYFEASRAATLRDVKRDKLFWFLAAAAFPGLGLLLLRVWYRAQRRG